MPNARRWYCDRCRAARKRHKSRMRELQGRPTATQRGYGSAHKRERARVKRIVDAGGARCARCGGLIDPRESWDLGHDDFDRSRYTGPEHRACNRATTGRRLIVREW